MTTTPTRSKGKYVTRSVYQKVCEENKRLKHDIYILTRKEELGKPSIQKIWVINEWRAKIEEDKKLAAALTAFAKEYLKTHPEFDIKNRMA